MPKMQTGTLGLKRHSDKTMLIKMENTMLLLAALAIIAGTMWSTYILWSGGMS
jgi:hypothetical protein